ncbi:MAG: DUF2794 domain-containing protein [Alphaproteobacteria bacterium]|nr:DUF2794 domain-containing protein [Alphaproteobacteria bacterium]
MDNLIRLSSQRPLSKHFFFTRQELSQLLSLYSSRVIAGEWRDYALDRHDDMAVFSIFRHSHERALYAIAKIQRRGQKKPTYALFNGARRLKTSSSLHEVVSTFEKLPRLVTG